MSFIYTVYTYDEQELNEYHSTDNIEEGLNYFHQAQDEYQNVYLYNSVDKSFVMAIERTENSLFDVMLKEILEKNNINKIN